MGDVTTRVPADLFRFTTAERAELHTAVLRAFGVANERLETSLTLDDVQLRLRDVGWSEQVTDDELTKSLAALRQWGLVDSNQHRYGLTKHGEAAYAGIQHALETLTSSGALPLTSATTRSPGSEGAKRSSDGPFGLLKVFMKNDSPPRMLRFSDFMMPPVALVSILAPPDMLSIAPPSARTASPWFSRTFATAKAGR